MTRELDPSDLAGSLGDKPAPPKVIILPRPPPTPTSVHHHSLSSHEWNTKNLPWRVTSDLTAAASAAGLVAPLYVHFTVDNNCLAL